MEKRPFFLLFFAFVTLHHAVIYMGCKKNHLVPFKVVKNYLIVSRIITLLMLYLWIKCFIIKQSWLPTSNVGWFGILLIVFGQVLNMSAYCALGVNGIYYGKEYGVVKNMNYESFPYSHFRDPQYTGCILTLLGLLFYILRKTCDPYSILLIVYTIVLYVLTMKVEENCVAISGT